MNSSFESKGLRHLGRAAMIAVLAVLFASGIFVLSADAGSSGAASEDGKAAASCSHAAAAAAPDGEAAAPCAGKEGGCASCDKAKDCPHAKGEACSDCGAKEKAPETH